MWPPMWPRVGARYHCSCGSRVLHAVTTSDMSRNLPPPTGECGNVRRGSGIEEGRIEGGRMAPPHLPRPSRLPRQVQTPFEPSHLSRAMLPRGRARRSLPVWRLCGSGRSKSDFGHQYRPPKPRERARRARSEGRVSDARTLDTSRGAVCTGVDHPSAGGPDGGPSDRSATRTDCERRC
jgi:hypothetical protein